MNENIDLTKILKKLSKRLNNTTTKIKYYGKFKFK